MHAQVSAWKRFRDNVSVAPMRSCFLLGLGALVSVTACSSSGGDGTGAGAGAGGTSASAGGMGGESSDGTGATSSSGGKGSGGSSNAGGTSTGGTSSGGASAGGSDTGGLGGSTGAGDTGGTGGGDTGGTGGGGTGGSSGPAVCGDGQVQAPEPCDDGDFDNTDDCTEQCKLPACGDGYVQPSANEDCDDGNGANGDGCNNDCSASGKVTGSVTHAGADGGDDKAYGVAIDGDGNVLVAGSSFVAGKGLEIFLWKLSPTLSEIKVRTVDGSGNHDDVARGVEVGPGNRVYVTADYYSETTPDDGNKAWAGVFTPLLGQVWADHTDEDVAAVDLVVDSNEHMFLAGTVIASNGSPDVWARRLTHDTMSDTWSEGWTRIIGHTYAGYPQNHPGYEPAQDIALTNDESMVYVVDWDRSNSYMWGNIFKIVTTSGNVSENPDSCCDGWRMYGNNTALHPSAITISQAGNVFVAAYLGSTSSPTGTMFRYPENLITGKTYNYPSWEDRFTVGAMVTTAIATGGTMGHPVAVGYAEATREGVITKRDAAGGGARWHKRIPGVHIENVAIAADDTIYAVGWTDVEGQPSDVWVGRFAP